MDLLALWSEFFLRPMLNGLVLLYSLLFSNFGIAIIVFTVIMRIIMLPLTLQQLRTSKAMSALQPKMQELRQRYGKDQQRLSQETMKLYREAGVNPVGCAVQTFIQFPIWIGLYQSIIQVLPVTPQGELIPEGLLHLSQNLYPWLPLANEVLPIARTFLWLDLARPDPSPFVLPALVGLSMWVQQKMVTMPSADPKQEATNRMMQTMMPLMFGFFTLQFASGLALYWLASNIIGVVMQYFITGWGSLAGWRFSLHTMASSAKAILGHGSRALPSGDGAIPDPLPANPSTPKKKRSAHGRGRDKRKDRR